MQNRASALKAALREAVRKAGGRLVILGHDNADMDSLLSCVLMQRLLAHWGMDGQIVLPLPEDGQCRRLMPQLGFDAGAWRGQTQAGDALILLDHHAPQHAGTVAAIIDHHPTDFAPQAPFVWIAQAGACAAMVYALLRASGAEANRADESLAVAALYLDTLALRSTKVSAEEIAWAKERAKALMLDESWLLREGLGLQDASLPAPVLAMTGKKRFVFGDKVVFSTYVQLDGMDEGLRAALLDALRAALCEAGADLWVFLHHDPFAMRSVQYDIWPDGSVEVTEHGRLISRGRDVMPRVERRMRENDGCES